jgi:hypothetical protein
MEKRALSAPELPAIPLVDIRDGGPVRHAGDRRERARGLRDTCLAWFPKVSHPLLPLMDAVARRWLARAQSPYLDEVSAIAGLLGFSGIWFLNGSYQWSCTALARAEDGAPWLARTLDWPFPGLGRFVEIARMRGPAGEFYNLTWPGYVGALTAFAPGRFAGCLNQAPLRRRTRDPRLRLFDLLANAVTTLRHARAIPPDQLLRLAFETAADYAAARTMLESTPIARPAIFALAGCRPHERCTIERTEHTANTRADELGAANDWLHAVPSWEGRIGASKLLTSSFEEAAAQSRARREGLALWRGSFARESFAWVTPPVLNPYTRVAVEMCPARGILRAVGYELPAGAECAEPVTQACELGIEPSATSNASALACAPAAN